MSASTTVAVVPKDKLLLWQLLCLEERVMMEEEVVEGRGGCCYKGGNLAEAQSQRRVCYQGGKKLRGGRKNPVEWGGGR